MTVFVFGNPDVAIDALPIKLLPSLRQRFPSASFVLKDPNEEWEVPEHLVVIDTVVGLERVRVFNDLASFDRSPRVSLHDFDALTQLRLLEKLGKLHRISIIGVPASLETDAALRAITETLRPMIDASDGVASG